VKIELDESTLAVVISASRAASTAYATSYSPSASSRTMGFGGEAAASIYLTGSADAFLRKCEQINPKTETPDLPDFPDLEVKTVPNIHSPHFAIGDGYSRDVKVADYLVLRCLAPTSFKVEGWLPSEEIEGAWKRYGEIRFPSGSPIIPCSMLRPEAFCPWRNHAIADRLP